MPDVTREPTTSTRPLQIFYLIAAVVLGGPLLFWVWQNPGNELYVVFVIPLVLGAGGVLPKLMIWVFLAMLLFFFSMFFWAWGR